MRYSRDGYRSYRKSSRDRSERSFSPPPSRHSNPYRYVSNSRDPQYDRSHSRYSRHESNYYQSNNRSSGFWNTKSNDSHDYYRRSPDVIEPEEHFDTATEPHTTCIFEWKVLKDPELTKEVSEVQYYHADSSKNTPITTQNSRPSEPNDPRLKCDYTTTKKAHMNATSFDVRFYMSVLIIKID